MALQHEDCENSVCKLCGGWFIGKVDKYITEADAMVLSGWVVENGEWICPNHKEKIGTNLKGDLT